MDETVLYEKRGAVAVVTLNRAASLNSFTRAMHEALWAAFERLAPYGPGAPEPLFALAGVRALGAQALNGGHVRCQLVAEDGSRIKAISWRSADTDLGKRLLSADSALHVVGRLKADDWNGKQGVQLEIEDVADPRQNP